jgi:type IV secretory pathway VirB2 component (pilin)
MRDRRLRQRHQQFVIKRNRACRGSRLISEVNMSSSVTERNAHSIRWPLCRILPAASIVFLLTPAVALAQSPWERAALNLEATFTGPLARSLSLVAIVIGGLMFMFGEAGAKRQISGIVFGGGLALFAGQFLTWLF